jgi:hypothetical protein
VHRNLVGGVLVPSKDTLPALTSCLSTCVKVFEGDVVNLCNTSVSAI